MGIGEDWKKDETEKVYELRKKAYDDPDRTTVEGPPAGRELSLPVDKELELEILSGPREGLKFKFPKGNIIIGRGGDADLTIDDDKISRKHAVVEAFSRDQIFISDLASTNGTYINGMRIRSTKLKDGDEIRIGKTLLKFSARDTES